MSAIKEWTKLTCDCGSTEFVASHELYWKDGQGTSAKQKGYLCAKCSKISGIDKLINAVKTRELDKKIAELEAERAAS